MAGIHNEVIYGANVDFREVWPPVGQMTQNGQLLIGGVASPNLAPGLITSTDGSIIWTVGQNTLDASASASSVFPWIDQGTNVVMAANHGYYATAAVTLTLPASPTQGQRVTVAADTSGSVVIQANTGQTIRFGTNTSSVAGTATNSSQGDSMTLVFRASTSTWIADSSPVGSWLSA